MNNIFSVLNSVSSDVFFKDILLAHASQGGLAGDVAHGVRVSPCVARAGSSIARIGKVVLGSALNRASPLARETLIPQLGRRHWAFGAFGLYCARTVGSARPISGLFLRVGAQHRSRFGLFLDNFTRWAHA